MKKDFIPLRNSHLDAWEETFLNALTGYSAQLGIPAPQVADITALIDAHRTSFTDALEAKTTAKGKVALMQSDKVQTVRAIRRLTRQIKASPAYTGPMGEAMGIVGPEHAPSGKPPRLKVKLVGGHPIVSYRKGGSHGIYLYSRRGNEPGFTLLAVDTRSPYADLRPNLDPSVPEERTYMAYYMHHDEQVGKAGQQTDILVKADGASA